MTRQEDCVWQNLQTDGKFDTLEAWAQAHQHGKSQKNLDT